MKIRIYIVDDEPMAIRYLKMMLGEQEAEYEVVGEETNSSRALKGIEKQKPDVVFADINMPVLNGLELSERILALFGDCRVILLTSYRDFDYIRQGLQIGVFDYVLKNEMTAEKLEALLEKAADDLALQRKKQQVILEHNVRQFLLNETGNHLEEDNAYRGKAPKRRYALIDAVLSPVIRLDHLSDVPEIMPDFERIREFVWPEGISCHAFVQMEKKEWCGIFYIEETCSDSKSSLERAARMIIVEAEKEKVRISCLISEATYRFFSLQDCYREFQTDRDRIYAFPDCSVFCREMLEKKAAAEHTIEEWLEKISTRISDEDNIGAWEVLQAAFADFRASMTVWEYTDALKGICGYLRGYIAGHGLRLEIMDIPQEYPSVKEAEMTLAESLGLVFSECRQKENEGYSPYIQRAIEYIHRHYREDFSITDLAEAVGVSEGHLRRLFKQELDAKIVDYITDYRIECAKLLMKNKGYLANEIWSIIGFSSAQYFSYVFKKKEGILPKDYAKQESAGPEPYPGEQK